MLSEAVILAGGLGTRLREVVSEVPKCLALVSQKPFLHYLLAYLKRQGVAKVLFSLGYKSELVLSFLQDYQAAHPEFVYDFVIEKYPLGTGGALALALTKAQASEVLVLNGDTFFDVPLEALVMQHEQSRATCSVALKKMFQISRYGVVTTEQSGRLSGFLEKAPRSEGYINGGIYVLHKDTFLAHAPQETFRFEQDFLSAKVSDLAFYGFHFDAYFIDIGIPIDYAQAQIDFQHF